MIGSHPGGTSLTQRLFELAEGECLIKGVDLGAGDGTSVRYLREKGYRVIGVDVIKERGKGDNRDFDGEDVIWGDMTELDFLEGSLDFCLAECSVSVCGDGKKALLEAYRVLRPGGSLLLSDVFFHKEEAPSLSMSKPLTFSCWEREFWKAGFEVRAMVDETPLWREFFLESLWNGNVDADLCEFFSKAGKAKCGYFLAWLRKGDGDGFI